MNKDLKLFGDAHKTVFTAAVFALAMMFMLWQVNFYLFANIRNTYFMALTPVLVAASLYFWRLKNGPEYALLVVFWLWYAASRILNGDPVLVYDYSAVTELSLMIPFFVLGLVLDTAARKRFLNWFSAAVGGYYFVLGLICLTAFVLRTLFVNPITGGVLGLNYGNVRINLLDINPAPRPTGI